MPKDVQNILRQPTRRSKVGIMIKLLSTVLLVGVFVSILEGTIFPLSQIFGHQRYNTTPVTERNEFRLVSIHRAGIGKIRNQVYQVLNIPSQSRLHRQSTTDGKYIISSTAGNTTRLADRSRQSIKSYMAQSRLQKQALRDPFSAYSPQSPVAEWITRDIIIPNITDKTTVTTLAKVASNAYIRIPDTEEWYDLGKKWNESNDFGWEEHGLRGHVFANADNSTIIVALKGTSPPFVGGSDTSSNDKTNVTPQYSSFYLTF